MTAKQLENHGNNTNTKMFPGEISLATRNTIENCQFTILSKTVANTYLESKAIPVYHNVINIHRQKDYNNICNIRLLKHCIPFCKKYKQ